MIPLLGEDFYICQEAKYFPDLVVDMLGQDRYDFLYDPYYIFTNTFYGSDYTANYVLVKLTDGYISNEDPNYIKLIAEAKEIYFCNGVIHSVITWDNFGINIRRDLFNKYFKLLPEDSYKLLIDQVDVSYNIIKQASNLFTKTLNNIKDYEY